MQPIKFNNVFRDGVQSNLGTNPTANEMLAMLPNIKEAGYDSVQAAGGTFMALFVDKGRDEWAQNTKLLGAFKEDGPPATALFRGDCVMGYDRNPQDVIDAIVLEMAQRGLKEITNFHGLNDERMQEGVFKAVKNARAQGHDIIAPKVICVEYNPNITVESCLEALERQAPMADSGIYIKNANGKAEPDMIYALVGAIAERFEGEEITLHSHNNHGLAYAIYLAGIEAAVEAGADLALDVLPAPLAEGTAQPSAARIYDMIANHPSEAVRKRAPQYKPENEEQDYKAIYELRFRYRNAETRYSKRLYDALYKAGMAGGATSTVKGINGMLPNLMAALKTDDEEGAFIALCEMEDEVKAHLGHPVSVTPYQKMLTEAAAFEVIYRNLGKEPYENMTAAVKNYLTGGLGAVPKTADSKLKARAIMESELEKEKDFIAAADLPPLMAASEKALKKAGYANPKRSDIATAAMLGKKGLEHVIARVKGVNKPQETPSLPDYLKPPHEGYSYKCGKSAYPYDIAKALGGASALERFAQAVCEMEKFSDGFYKAGLDDCGACYTRMRKDDEFQVISAREKYLCTLYKSWMRQAHEEAGDFVAEIPAKLKAYGLSAVQATGSMKQVQEILYDVVDAKAKNASLRSLPALDAAKISKAYNEAVNVQSPCEAPIRFSGQL